jgi:hypothetical protein
MADRPSPSNSTKETNQVLNRNLASLVAPKYLQHVDTIISQRLVSAIWPPSAFCASSGFIVANHNEALGAIERFASFGTSHENPRIFSEIIANQLRAPNDCYRIQFPESLLASNPLLRHYQTCTINPFATSRRIVQFGDGVLPHNLHDHMQLPSQVVAEQRKFILEPIPQTRGAKAFSVEAAALLLEELLESHPNMTTRATGRTLEVVYQEELFVAELDVISFRPCSDIYHGDLIIFPCSGIEVPHQYKERLTLDVSPKRTSSCETVEEIEFESQRLASLTSIITSSLQELFGARTLTHLRSVPRVAGSQKSSDSDPRV